MLTKNEIFEEAHRYNCSTSVIPTGRHELLLIQSKNKKHHIKLLFFNWKWYASVDEKVERKSVDDTWIHAQLKALA